VSERDAVAASTADAVAASTPGSTAAALGVTAAWAAALALLGALWIRTPLSGPGPMFALWSLPAAALAALTVRWLRRLALPQVRVTRARLATLAALWTAAAAAALLLTDFAAELALDGFILRRPLTRAAALGLAWLPALFGLGLCVLGLAAALEARYRIAHRDAAPRAAAPLTPTGP
jgi:hypothetical protein